MVGGGADGDSGDGIGRQQDDHDAYSVDGSVPYFVHTADDLVWASYTDARGELTTEHIPAETARDSISPASRESEY